MERPCSNGQYLNGNIVGRYTLSHGLNSNAKLVDNVDYNDLKRLIKVRTTRGQGQALTIPGHQNEAKSLQSFENEFFAELVDQHQRVDLFVRSKAGEINRRLVHLDKQVGHLQERYPSYQTQKISVRCLERFAKVEEAVENAGEEIRSLARFVGAQKLAFVKLLKKYKRWTASSSLEVRFRTKILNQPTAFSKRDFQPLLTQYNDVLAAVRAPFESDQHVKDPRKGIGPQPKASNGSVRESHKTLEQRESQSHHTNRAPANSPATQIQAACQGPSDVDFDNALVILPLGKFGGKASYWVHPDNLVELHVLLLRYTRLRRASSQCTENPDSNGSKHQSRRQSTNGNGNYLVNGADEDAGLVICDDLQSFARRRSGAPISDTEESAGGVLESAAATVQYSSSGEALLTINTSLNDAKESHTPRPFKSSKIKKKFVRYLFGSGQSKSAIPTLDEQGSEESEDLRPMQKWLNGHQEIQPLVNLQSKRTRFVGLRNDDSGGMWATLDRDIVMKTTSKEFFCGKEGDLAFDSRETGESVSFSFAVLEVRYEGGSGTDFLAALNESHLVRLFLYKDGVQGRGINGSHRPKESEDSQWRLMP